VKAYSIKNIGAYSPIGSLIVHIKKIVNIKEKIIPEYNDDTEYILSTKF
jgi:hypothetical protein